jgi:hypothetical protein
MPKVLDFERYGKSSRITISNGEREMLWILADGNLETYMEAYQLMPGEAFALILLDICDDSVDVPPYLQEDMRGIVEDILKKSNTIEWAEGLDRDEVLSQITVSRDTAPELSQTWRENRLRDEEAIAANQNRQMELEAAEYVDALPASVRAQPRDNDSIQAMDSLGLAIQFVD